MKEVQQEIITKGQSESLASMELDLQRKLEDRYKQEEILWRQKSRIRWLKEGERNTKFFHSSTIQRRMQNRIGHLTNQQGERMERHEDMERELVDYFKGIQQEPQVNRHPAIE